MTLALYGKSKRRQGGLILAGFVALLVAVLGALTAVQSARAHSTFIEIDQPTCESPGWKVRVYRDKWDNYREVVFTGAAGAEPYEPYLLKGAAADILVINQLANTGSVNSVGSVQMYSGSFKNGIDLDEDVDTTETSIKVDESIPSSYTVGGVIIMGNELMKITAIDNNWPGYYLTVTRAFGGTTAAEHDDFSFNDEIHVWDRNDNPSETEPWNIQFDSTTCKGTVIVQKVVSGTGSDVSDDFGGDVKKGGVTTQTFTDLSQDAPKTYTNQPIGEYKVEETNPGSYTRLGYAPGTWDGQAATCPANETSSGSESAAQTLAHTGTIVFCIYNRLDAQVIAPEVKKVAVDYHNPADAPDGLDLSNGWALWDIVITQAAGPDNPAIEDFVVVDGYNDIAIHSQVVNGQYVDACSLVGDTLTCDLPAGNFDITVRVRRAIGPVIQDRCLGGPIDNYLVSAAMPDGTPVNPTEGTTPITYTVPGVSSACGVPSISKTVTNGDPNSPLTTTNPSDVSWTVEVVNPANGGTGIEKTVVIKELNDVVVTDGPHYTNANCTIPGGSSFEAELNSANGVSCTMGGNPQSKIVFGVQPASIAPRACQDQEFYNTATITFDQTTLEGVGPKITLEKDLTNCRVPVTFSKYICQEYSHVPRNEGPGGQNDIGKDDGPAGLTQANLGAKGPADNDEAVDPGNDGEGASCALATTPWTFNIWKTTRVNGVGGGSGPENDQPLQTFAITGSQQVVLNAAALAETLKGSGAYIEEVYKAGYGFGALKCYTDHLNDDNWEWLNFQSGIPTGEVHCIAYNVPATRDVEVCKIVVGNGDGIVDGGKFVIGAASGAKIELTAYEPAVDDTDDAPGTPACGTIKLAFTDSSIYEWGGDWRPGTNLPGTWNGDDPAYPKAKDGAVPENEICPGEQEETINLTKETVTVTFCNKTERRERKIVIEKYFLTDGDVTEGDYPTFVFDNYPIDPECSVDASQSPKVVWTCTVPADWNGTIDEIEAASWQEVTAPESCPPLDEQPEGPSVDFVQNEENQESDQRRLWTFCNRPVGTVVVIKYENVFPAGLKNWTIDGTLPAAPFVLQTNGTGLDGGTDSDIETFTNVPVGDYSLFEVQGRDACTDGSTSSDWQTHGVVQVGGTAPEGPDLNSEPVIGDSSQPFSVQKGVTTYVVFGNVSCGAVLSGQSLEVNKFLDLLGNFSGTTPLDGWTITATGIAGAATGDVLVEVTGLAAPAGKALFLSIDDGTYEVCETPQTGYDVIGSDYNGSTQGGACRTVVVLLGETTVVDFYNQPRLTIVATKTIFNDANQDGANGREGWTFTLTGCGITPSSKTTDASGQVSWTDLDPAVNCQYVVTESVKSGWIADDYTKETNAQGGTVTLRFVNRQVSFDPTPTPTTPSLVETPTPETPTNTPVTPTEDTGEEPDDDLDDDVEGEKTPGPGEPTPIAPDTGVGVGSTSAGMNVLLIIAGLIAISGGLSFIALGRRKS